jgi:methionyl-tRNA formyltransferase
MRLVFIGATKFALRCLNIVLGISECEVVGAVAAPAAFRISYRPDQFDNVLHADVRSHCAELGIGCAVINNDGMRDDALLTQVACWQPDAFLVVGWYHLVPRRWRDLAPAYGLHASLLPDYRGGAPLVWAIINGERKTGLTLFRLDDGVDKGPIVGQASTYIDSDDTIASVYTRVEELAVALLSEHLPALAAGTARLLVQDESRRRLFRQRGPEDGLVDWQKSAHELHNFVRAQTRPYPGAFTTWEGRKLRLWRAREANLVDVTGAAAGEVLPEASTTLVKSGTSVIELLEVGYEGTTLTGRELRALVGEGAILGA